MENAINFVNTTITITTHTLNNKWLQPSHLEVQPKVNCNTFPSEKALLTEGSHKLLIMSAVEF